MTFCHYLIDESDWIYGVGGVWDDFAMENGGESAVSEAVVGTKLWAHVHGLEVKSYLNAVFYAVRMSGISIVLPYRCDSPTHPRLFSMTVSSGNAGCLRVDHYSRPTLIESRAQNVAEFSEFGSQTKCSVCCAFKVGEEWLDPFVQPNVLDFPMGQGLCSTCKASASESISQVLEMERRHRRTWPSS